MESLPLHNNPYDFALALYEQGFEHLYVLSAVQLNRFPNTTATWNEVKRAREDYYRSLGQKDDE